jgi:hypothetical protein
MSKSYKYLFSLLFLPVLSSCYTTSSISVDILRPAEIALPAEINHIAVLNRSLINVPDSVINDTTVVIESMPEYLYNLTTTEAVKSLGFIVQEIPSVLTIPNEYILESVPDDSIYVPARLNNNELSELAFKLETDALITLDYIFINDRLGTDTLYQLSSGIYEPYYVAYISRQVSAVWRFYDLGRLIMLDEFIFKDSLKFYARKSDWEAPNAILLMRNDLDFIRTSYLETGYHLGYYYAKRISPTFSPEERNFFSGKTIWLKRAGKFISQNKWDAAEEILLSFIRHENPQKAAAAFYNLALISEMESDLELARFYVKMALKYYQSEFYYDYLKLLETRILEKRIIDQQLVF